MEKKKQLQTHEFFHDIYLLYESLSDHLSVAFSFFKSQISVIRDC